MAALAGLCATFAMGLWQLSRAADKTALQDTMDARRLLPVLEGSAWLQDQAIDGHLHRRVALRGTWVQGQTVFLDNRQMNGKPGFFVLTPLQPDSSSTAILVQRGWISRNFTDRARLPKVPTPTGAVVIEGRIAPPPSKLYEFEESHVGVIRQNLALEQFSSEIGLPLAGVSVLQLGLSDDGLLRDWPRVNLGVEKHYGYAFQWFALSGLITLLYAWFQIVRRFFPPR